MLWKSDERVVLGRELEILGVESGVPRKVVRNGHDRTQGKVCRQHAVCSLQLLSKPVQGFTGALDCWTLTCRDVQVT